MSQTNHQVRLAARPTGLPDASSWEVTTEPVLGMPGWPFARWLVFARKPLP